jgi:predicted Mrr-cat superfamily restriction endonuclease
MQIWRLIARREKPDEAIQAFLRRRRIAIGWHRTGDLRRSRPHDAAEIANMIREKDPKARNAHLGGPSLWRFYREMRVGDLVIVGNRRRRCLVMRVEGDYRWDKSAPGRWSQHHL